MSPNETTTVHDNFTTTVHDNFTTTNSPNETTPAFSNATSTTSTENPGTSATTEPFMTTAAPPCKPGQHFDTASFVGGIVLALGVVAIAYFGWKFYKSKTDHRYSQF
jgi:CD164 antigen